MTAMIGHPRSPRNVVILRDRPCLGMRLRSTLNTGPPLNPEFAQMRTHLLQGCRYLPGLKGIFPQKRWYQSLRKDRRPLFMLRLGSKCILLLSSRLPWISPNPSLWNCPTVNSGQTLQRPLGLGRLWQRTGACRLRWRYMAQFKWHPQPSGSSWVWFILPRHSSAGICPQKSEQRP